MDIASQPGRGIGCDISRGETVEADLDRFIALRHEKRVKSEGERQAEEAWRQSVGTYEEKRRQIARAEWHLHHTSQAERLRRTLEALATHHEEQAARLMDVRAKGA